MFDWTKLQRLFTLIFCLVLIACSQNQNIPTQNETGKQDNIIDGVIWEAGNWEPHLSPKEKGRSWGNHRAVVKTESNHQAVGVRIPWRRSDDNPQDKAVFVVDAQSDQALHNVIVKSINNEFGEIIFEPNNRSKIYHVYYFPFESGNINGYIR